MNEILSPTINPEGDFSTDEAREGVEGTIGDVAEGADSISSETRSGWWPIILIGGGVLLLVAPVIVVFGGTLWWWARRN